MHSERSGHSHGPGKRHAPEGGNTSCEGHEKKKEIFENNFIMWTVQKKNDVKCVGTIDMDTFT